MSARKHKDVVFVDVSDGSSAATHQLVVKKEHCPKYAATVQFPCT